MIYIVEDDASIRELEQYALQSNGYEVQGFESAEKYGIRNSENMFAAALHVCGLYDGALQGISGRYYEDSVYNVSEEAVREFDKNFPPKTPISGTPSQQYFLEMVNNCRPYDGK